MTTVREALSNLALHSGTVAKRRDEQTRCLVELGEIFDPTEHADPIARQCLDILGRLASHDVRHDVRQLLAHAWKDLLHKPVGGIAVGWMRETPHEKQPLTACEGAPEVVWRMDVGNHVHGQAGGLAQEKVAFASTFRASASSIFWCRSASR